MLSLRRGVAAAAIIGSMLAGGAIGATVFSASAGSAATTTSTSTSGATVNGSGTFRSNEDPAHEKTESAAREAQENAGQMPTIP